MDIVTSANSESAILTSLERNLVADPYSYRLSQNFPNQSKSIVTVQPQVSPGGSTHGAELHFRLPRYGLKTKAVLVSDLTFTAATIGAPRLGERVFQNIEMRSHNKVICTQSPESCTCRIDNLGQEANNAYTSVTEAVPAVTALTGATECYTPIFTPFSEKTSNFLDLSFVESLEIVATVNTAAGMGITAGTLASATYYLLVFYINLSNEAEQAYISKNFPASSPFTMLGYDQYREVPYTFTASGASAQTVNIDLKCNNAVYATHFLVKLDSDQTNVAIDSFELTATGRTLVSSNARTNIFDTGSFGVSGSSSGGTSGTITYLAGNRPLTYFYGCSKDRTFNSGSVAYSNLNAPRATIVFTASGAVSYTVYVVHEYWALTTINPSDGSINRGLSS